MIQSIFWSSRERRLRFFWRVLLVVLGMLILSTLLTVVLAPQALVSVTALADPAIFFRVGLATLLAYGFAIWVGGRLLDRRPFIDFGLRLGATWWRDFGFGFALGALLITLVFFVEWTSGWVTIRGTLVRYQDRPFAGSWLLAFAGFICIGIYEELAFRGYGLTNVAEWLANFRAVSPRVAVITATVLSSAVFGLLHALNPNASVVSTVNIFIAGLFNLSLGYILTGQLGISIGLHIAWNLFQSAVFGFAVSGLDVGVTLVAIDQGGPSVWTGGPFGPEAGLLGLAAMLLGGLLIVEWVRWRRGKVTIAEGVAEYSPTHEEPA